MTPDDVLQGYEHISPPRRREIAKEMGKGLFIGARCGKHGIRIRTRSNHCILCNKQGLRHQRDWSRKAFVYIAGSLSGRLIKIGNSEDCTQRMVLLRREGYGGCRDWSLLKLIEVTGAGEVESLAKNALAEFSVSKRYYKGDATGGQGTIELYACSYSKAAEAIRLAMRGKLWEGSWWASDTDLYEFGEEGDTTG